jgi:hypothetical protein
LVLQSFYNNISFYSYYVNIVRLYNFLSFSRTFDNVYNSLDSSFFDTYVLELNSETESEISDDLVVDVSILGNRTVFDDEFVIMSLNLEEQFVFSGFYVFNQLYSPELLNFFFSYSFFSYYKEICSFLSRSLLSLVPFFNIFSYYYYSLIFFYYILSFIYTSFLYRVFFL